MLSGGKSKIEHMLTCSSRVTLRNLLQVVTVVRYVVIITTGIITVGNVAVLPKTVSAENIHIVIGGIKSTNERTRSAY